MSGLSNKEQADLVKAFWNDYGRWIAVAILVGLLVGFGWRWFNDHREKQHVAASTLYNHLMNASMSGESSQPVDTAIMHRFKQDYPTSTYRELAEMFLARQGVSKGDLTKAARVLRSSIHAGANPALVDLARVRLARVQLAQAKPAKALKTLQGLSPKASSLMVMAANIERAKAYRAMNKPEKAQQLMASVQAQAKSAGVELPGYILG
jgi:predicted negative regulator of RcsB-dependent stress response